MAFSITFIYSFAPIRFILSIDFIDQFWQHHFFETNKMRDKVNWPVSLKVYFLQYLKQMR